MKMTKLSTASIANARWWVYSSTIFIKLTYLIIRSTNHGGLSPNPSIWPADSVFSLVGRSSCMLSYSTTTWSPASLFLSSSQFSSRYTYVLRFLFLLTNSWLTLLTRPYISPTSHAFLNACSSSAHMQSQVQSARRCLSIYPASLPMFLSSVGMLWTK